MPEVELLYMTDGTSGETWAVEVAHGGEMNGDVSLVTGVCGPLSFEEITQANLDSKNFNWDTEPDQLAWAEDTLRQRRSPPYYGDRA